MQRSILILTINPIWSLGNLPISSIVYTLACVRSMVINAIWTKLFIEIFPKLWYLPKLNIQAVISKWLNWEQIYFILYFVVLQLSSWFLPLLSYWIFLFTNQPYVLVSSHSIILFFEQLQVVLGEERFHGIASMSFGITLTRPALMFNQKAILSLFTGLVSLS